MQPQGMSDRYFGMFEDGVRIFLHAEPFHHGARPLVSDSGKGHDFLKLQTLESDAQTPARRFRGVALAPGLKRQPPADFHTWRKRPMNRPFSFI
jgi:hypothetical protein